MTIICSPLSSTSNSVSSSFSASNNFSHLHSVENKFVRLADIQQCNVGIKLSLCVRRETVGKIKTKENNPLLYSRNVQRKNRKTSHPFSKLNHGDDYGLGIFSTLAVAKDHEVADSVNAFALNITVRAEDLKAAIGRVLPAISKKSGQNPLLEHILLEVEVGDNSTGFATVMATDGFIAMRSPVVLETVASGGIAAVPAKTLYDLLGHEGPTSVVEISAGKDGAGITLRSGKSAMAVLRGEFAGDFPPMPKVEPAVKVEVSRGVLRDALLRAKIAAARDDEDRQNINSVFLTISRGQVLLISTDGRLCGRLNFLPKVDPNFNGSFILPLRSVDEICRLLGGVSKATSRKAQIAAMEKDKEEVVLELQRERISVHLLDGAVVGSQLLIGEYPDIAPLLKREPQVRVTANRQELISHLRKISLFGGKANDKNSKAVQISLSTGLLTLRATSAAVGEYEVSMEVEYEGASMNIGFNPVLLIDILQHIDGEMATVGILKHGTSGLAIIRDPEATFLLAGLVDTVTS